MGKTAPNPGFPQTVKGFIYWEPSLRAAKPRGNPEQAVTARRLAIRAARPRADTARQTAPRPRTVSLKPQRIQTGPTDTSFLSL